MKKVPEFKSDAEAEAFLEQDLSDLDFTQFKPMRFEFAPEPKAALRLSLPATLLDAVKRKAAAKGVPYTHYVRMVLEADVGRS